MKWIICISRKIQHSKTESGSSRKLSRPIATNETEAVIKKTPDTQSPDQMASQANFTKHLGNS